MSNNNNWRPPPPPPPRMPKQHQEQRQQFPPPPPPPPPPSSSTMSRPMVPPSLPQPVPQNGFGPGHHHPGQYQQPPPPPRPSMRQKQQQQPQYGQQQPFRPPLPPPPPPPPPMVNQQQSQYQQESFSSQNHQQYQNGSSNMSMQRPPPPPMHSAPPPRPPPPPPPSAQQQGNMAGITSRYPQPVTSSSTMAPPPPPPHPSTTPFAARPQDPSMYPQQYANNVVVAAAANTTTTTGNMNAPPVFCISSPPLFTRSSVDEATTDDDKPLDVYYPKGHISNTTTPTKPPPAADSRFIVLDDGNASPHLIRSTMYTIPIDRNVLRQAIGNDNNNHQCMGVICCPLALPSSDYPPYTSINDPSTNNNDYSVNDVDPYSYLPSLQQLGQIPVDYTTNRESPPRCSRCYAYINPFWTLTKCNFCNNRNRNIGSTQYGQQVGTVEYPVQGPYITRSKPVEPHWIFCLDITAPLVLEYVDLILDIIWPTYYKTIVQIQQQTLQQNGRKIVSPRVTIVFCTSTGIYIPQKENGGKECNGFLVMPDVQEQPYCPLPLEEWTWSLLDEYDTLMEVWKNEIRPTLVSRLIQEQCHNYRTADGHGGYSMSVGGAALAFLADALEDTGGRGVFWTWRRPNYGIGTLLDRERGVMTLSGKNEASAAAASAAMASTGPSLYMPLQDSIKNNSVQRDPTVKAAADFYTDLGDKCAKSKVALDVIIHTNPNVPQSFLDIATLGRLCEKTSGRLCWIDKIPYESTDAWKTAIRQEIMRPLYLGGWDVIFKVRCSQGLAIRSILSSVGSLSTASSLTDALNNQDDELELSVVTPETCIGVTLDHRVGGLPKNSEYAFLQTALLYTNPWTGDRRIRISTLALRISTHPHNIIPSIDFGALAALQLRTNLPHGNYPSKSLSLDGNDGGTSGTDVSSPDQKGDNILSEARQGLIGSCTQILSAYRQLISQQRPPSMNEFLVPDSLQLLPLFVMSAFKSPLLRPSLPRRGTGTRTVVPSPGGDERAYYFYCARKVSPSAALLLVSPILFDLGSSLEPQSSPENLFEWKNLQEPGTATLDIMVSSKKSPFVKLPKPLPSTVSNLSENGLYLLDTCFALYVLMEGDATDNDDELPSKIQNAKSQLQIWSQVGKEPKYLRPTENLPIIPIYQKQDVAEYQSLLRWMVLDATSHERDFGAFCAELNRNVQKTG